MKDAENAKNHTKTIYLMVRQITQNIKGSKILLERNSPRKRKLLKLNVLNYLNVLSQVLELKLVQ